MLTLALMHQNRWSEALPAGSSATSGRRGSTITS